MQSQGSRGKDPIESASQIHVVSCYTKGERQVTFLGLIVKALHFLTDLGRSLKILEDLNRSTDLERSHQILSDLYLYQLSTLQIEICVTSCSGSCLLSLESGLLLGKLSSCSNSLKMIQTWKKYLESTRQELCERSLRFEINM